MRSHLSGQQLCVVFVLADSKGSLGLVSTWKWLSEIQLCLVKYLWVMQWLMRDGLNQIGRRDITSLSILKLFPVRSKGHTVKITNLHVTNV